LEEGVGDHHQCAPMQSLPGSALEVIDTEFFYHLLVRLLANPSRLDVAAKVPKSVCAGTLARP
jgi:hypothetical protein